MGDAAEAQPADAVKGKGGKKPEADGKGKGKAAKGKGKESGKGKDGDKKGKGGGKGKEKGKGKGAGGESKGDGWSSPQEWTAASWGGGWSSWESWDAKSAWANWTPPQQKKQYEARQTEAYLNQVVAYQQSLHTWVTYETDGGVPYYYNYATGVTQWEKPAEIISADAIVQRTAAQLKGEDTADANGEGGGYTLFIFHLPEEWTDENLQTNFSPFGKISSAHVMIDRASKSSRGFGFVTYAEEAEASRAIMEMNGFRAGGKRLKVELKSQMRSGTDGADKSKQRKAKGGGKKAEE